MMRTRGNRRTKRDGIAAVELVLLLPVLCYVCLISVDYARLFFALATLSDCARSGALYASDPNIAASTGYTSVSQAALADAGDLSPAPTVTQTGGTDSSGNAYVEVTVAYTFQSVANYPGVPTSAALSRKVRMATTPP